MFHMHVLKTSICFTFLRRSLSKANLYKSWSRLARLKSGTPYALTKEYSLIQDGDLSGFILDRVRFIIQVSWWTTCCKHHYFVEYRVPEKEEMVLFCRNNRFVCTYVCFRFNSINTVVWIHVSIWSHASSVPGHVNWNRNVRSEVVDWEVVSVCMPIENSSDNVVVAINNTPKFPRPSKMASSYARGNMW